MGLALGQAEVTVLEMTQFAATIANGGRRVTATPVARAIDAAGVERIGPPRAGPPVLDPTAAALTRELMRLVIDQGTGGAARGAGYTGPAIGKTGTSDGEKDLWFVGSTPSVAASVWIGYDRPAPIRASASDLAAPLWGAWTSRLARLGAGRADFASEPRLVRRTICAESGKIPNATCRTVGAAFLPGTAPSTGCRVDHAAQQDVVDRGPRESLWTRRANDRRAREQAAHGDPDEATELDRGEALDDPSGAEASP
jgi:membrane peptidoglycan carboxypeptidase